MKLEVVVSVELSMRLLTHCSNYSQLGKTRVQSTTRYRSFQSTLNRRMRGKDAINPTTSLSTVVILSLLSWLGISLCMPNQDAKVGDNHTNADRT